MRSETTADDPPRRLTCDDARASRVEVYFDGARRRGDVQEYDADQGWILVRRVVGFGRFAKLRTVRLHGRVEPRWRDE